MISNTDLRGLKHDLNTKDMYTRFGGVKWSSYSQAIAQFKVKEI